MTIHSDHPFATPEPDRDPVRRLRGRLPAPVTVWTTGEGRTREGWTVSSMLVADGDPAEVLGLLDEDSELADAVAVTGTACISVLGYAHRALADAFARIAPAPGGPFRMGEWEDTAWGPRLVGASWLGVRLEPDPDHAGWALLLRGRIEHAEPGEAMPMAHVRGRYRDLDGPPSPSH
ncbi:flavin reductase family protein [Mariniluteicoccus flavus]